MTKVPIAISRRTVLAAALAAGAMARSSAQEAAPGVAEIRALLEEGRYLPLLQFYRDRIGTEAGADQLAAQLAAMTGDEEAAFDATPTASLALPDLTGCVAADAVETIVQAARTRQIVILSEAHTLSRCRAFAGVLAVRLAEEGFTVFAAETFDNAAPDALAALNGGGAVTPAEGWYLADPVYAETVRAARRRGYRFAGYEARAAQLAGAATDQSLAVREDAQANNFIAAVLDRDPKARAFVVCGYDHVLKTQTPDGALWFAARLKAKTGRDPLCIAQHLLVPPPDPAREDLSLKTLLDTFQPTVPVVIFGSDKVPLPLALPKGAVDVEVVHPRLPPIEGRPGWLAAGRSPARFGLAALPGPNDLIQAVPIGEASTVNAVPADQYRLPLAAREAMFFLPAGTYQVRIESEDGRRVVGELQV